VLHRASFHPPSAARSGCHRGGAAGAGLDGGGASVRALDAAAAATAMLCSAPSLSQSLPLGMNQVRHVSATCPKLPPHQRKTIKNEHRCQSCTVLQLRVSIMSGFVVGGQSWTNPIYS